MTLVFVMTKGAKVAEPCCPLPVSVASVEFDPPPPQALRQANNIAALTALVVCRLWGKCELELAVTGFECVTAGL